MGPLGASEAPKRAFCKGARAARRASTLGVREAAEPPRARGMAQFAKGLRLDLTDPHARDREADADLLQGVVRALADPEAQPQDLLLAGREGREHLPGVVLEIEAHDRVGGRDRRL